MLLPFSLHISLPLSLFLSTSISLSLSLFHPLKPTGKKRTNNNNIKHEASCHFPSGKCGSTAHILTKIGYVSSNKNMIWSDAKVTSPPKPCYLTSRSFLNRNIFSQAERYSEMAHTLHASNLSARSTHFYSLSSSIDITITFSFSLSKRKVDASQSIRI